MTVTEGSQFALVPRPAERPFADRVWSLETHQTRRESHERSDGAPLPHDRVELKQATLEARIALEEAVVAAAMAAQRAISMAEVLDEALAVLEETEGVTAAPSLVHEVKIPPAALSPREREVLALVAEGRTNKAIAETLFVSPNTIKTHVASLLAKLRADSRAQLAAIATRGALR
ncbi:MAG: response regulator transcription factor [Thermomicrobiales bacterium]